MLWLECCGWNVAAGGESPGARNGFGGFGWVAFWSRSDQRQWLLGLEGPGENGDGHFDRFLLDRFVGKLERQSS